MAAPAPLTLHMRCRVTNIGHGEVLFVGQTSFASGTWVGVHLDEPRGKNDGAVQGKRYFTCEPLYGVFVRPTQVHPEEKIEPRTPSAHVAATPRTAYRTATATPRESAETPRSVRRMTSIGDARSSTLRTPRSSTRSPFFSPSERAKQRVEAGRASRPLPTKPNPFEQRKTEAPTPVSPAPVRTHSPVRLSPSYSLRQASPDHTARLIELEAAASKHIDRIAALERDCAALSAVSAQHEDIKKRVHELECERAELRERLHEANEGLEMATLDREMAEERAEALELELKTAKDTAEELRLERELQAESARAAMPADAAVLQTENARLREALLRLRDAAQEADTQQRKELVSLRTELLHHEELVSEHAKVMEQLARLESLVVELRTQADVAQGAEEMLETLTEQHSALEEHVEKLTTELQELEALHAVSEELEATHMETEAQLQRDLDLRDELIANLRAERASLHAHLTAHTSTIEQFRTLVAELTKERDTFRAKCDAPPVPAPRAPVVEPVRAPVLAHDRLAIASALQVQHLSMLRSYVIDAFADADEGAVLSLLMYKRIAALSELVRTALARIEVPEVAHDDTYMMQCSVRRALAHVGALATQIAAVLESSSSDVFVSRSTDHVHVSHLMHRMEALANALEHDALDDAVCEAECRDTVAQLEAIMQSLPLCTSLHDLAAKEVGSALLAWHDIEIVYACVGVLHATASSLAGVTSRALVACRRLYRRLHALRAQNETVDAAHVNTLPDVSRLASAMVPRIMPWANAVLEHADTSHFETLDTLAHDMRSLADMADAVLAAASAQDHVVLLPKCAPWRERADALRAQTTVIEASEPNKAQIETQGERIGLLETALAERDDAVQAADIKIERLRHQLERAHALAAEVTDARQEAEELRAKLETQGTSSTTPALVALDADTDDRVKMRLDERALRATLAEQREFKAHVWLTQLASLAPLSTPTTAPYSHARDPSLDALSRRLSNLATSPRVVELDSCKPPAIQLASFRQARRAAAYALASCT